MDEKHWATVECKDGHVYYDAEITANARVQEIMIRAQANKTELGYWKDVATDLAELVDEMQAKLDLTQVRYEIARDLITAKYGG